MSHGPTVGGFLLIAVPAGVAGAVAWALWPVAARRWRVWRGLPAWTVLPGPGPQDGAGQLSDDENAAWKTLCDEEAPR